MRMKLVAFDHNQAQAVVIIACPRVPPENTHTWTLTYNWTCRYDVRVEAGKVTYKKIMYVNPDAFDREYTLVSSHPDLLSFRYTHTE
jgi:hypothetical protein